LVQYIFFTRHKQEPLIADEIEEALSALASDAASESEDVVVVGAVHRDQSRMEYSRTWQKAGHGKFTEISEGLGVGDTPDPWMEMLTACATTHGGPGSENAP
jgi:UDP-N-acetylglucosamine 2-epimerase